MAFWRRDRHPGLPEDWREQARHAVTWFEPMVEAEQERIGELADRLLREKHWEASDGFALTDEIRLTIALQASLLILGLSFDHYRRVTTIIVHPSTMLRPGQRYLGSGLYTDDPLAILGEASHGAGPVVIAWDEARRNARHPEHGHDVVFHEFAHKLDMLDDVVDGMPPLRTREGRERWIAVCTAEFEAVRSHDPSTLIWDYAGQDPGEFFAVVTEVFFDRPRDLRHHNPELYDLLRQFYAQDPAALPETG